MAKVIQWAHIVIGGFNYEEDDKQFKQQFETQINQMQNNNLEVEIQYQQSDYGYSVFMLGREKQ